MNPLSIDDIDALTIASLRSLGTTPERFYALGHPTMPQDAMQRGEEIIRRNPKIQMPFSHFKLQSAQEQQMMDDEELEIPEFHFDEGEQLSIITIRGLGVTEIQYQIDQLMLWFGSFEREIKNFDKELIKRD